jgi:hypothetical protein
MGNSRSPDQWRPPAAVHRIQRRADRGIAGSLTIRGRAEVLARGAYHARGPLLRQSVEGSQNGSSPVSLESRELKAESRILHRDGRMTAEEEPRETKQERNEGWHEPGFLDYPVMKVKPLPATRILANHTSRQPPILMLPATVYDARLNCVN